MAAAKDMQGQSADKVKLAVAGAGLAGLQHIAAIGQVEEVELAAVADPDATQLAALDEGVARYASPQEMLNAMRPDGVIVATPNHLHAAHGLACVAAGVPALIEKPIAADTATAEPLVAAAEAGGVPLLIGHHRRHNPLVAAAHEVIAGGELGRLTALHSQTWLIKPDDYFRAEWRRRRGAGPVFINLIHDIDLLRHLCGEIAGVRAVSSNAVRGFEVEDTAAVLLEFQNGALGTMSVSDTVVAPWSWELTARENPAYPATTETCYWIGGTRGSLSLPNLTLWQSPGARSWWAPIAGAKLVFEFGGHSLIRQVRHFAAVIRGHEQPLVAGRDGLESLTAVEAVKRSAESGRRVQLGAA